MSLQFWNVHGIYISLSEVEEPTRKFESITICKNILLFSAGVSTSDKKYYERFFIIVLL